MRSVRIVSLKLKLNSEKRWPGWFAVDIHEKRNQLIREFDPNAEILLIPRVQGRIDGRATMPGGEV
jgi:hypothetical protein